MDITAAVTITFYFIGLVNFHDRPAGRTGREVILPAAATGTYAGIALETHRADIVVTGFQGGQTACTTTNGWVWKDADALLPETCTIEGVSQKVLTLPSSTDAFDASTFAVPKLTSFCCLSDLDTKYLKDPNQSALRVTITNGTLSGCTDGKAWVSRLGITGDDTFTFDGKSLTLNNDAVVYIINAPPHPPDPADEKHFYWYYVLYGATSCRGLPPTPAGSGCPADVLALTYRHGHPAASGVGCSNTGYP